MFGLFKRKSRICKRKTSKYQLYRLPNNKVKKSVWLVVSMQKEGLIGSVDNAKNNHECFLLRHAEKSRHTKKQTG